MVAKSKPRKMQPAKRLPKNLKAPASSGPVTPPAPIDAPEPTADAPEGRTAGVDLLATGREYVEAYNEIQRLESLIAPLKKKMQNLEPALLEDMGAGGCTKFSVDGRTLYRKSFSNVSVVPETKQEAIEVARECGFADLLTFNAQSLTARMKQYAIANGDGEEESVLNIEQLPEALRPYLMVYNGHKLGNTKA